MKKIFLVAWLSLGYSTFVLGQYNLGNRINNAINKKIDQGIDRSIDKGLNESEEKIREKGKESIQGKENTNSTNNPSESKSSNNSNSTGTTSNETKSGANSGEYKVYSKFDFVPGEKVIAIEDFTQDAIGDFPAKWNTNGGAELVTLEGQQGKWLKIAPMSVLYPEFITTSLPENFTLEFNLAASPDFSYYSSAFHCIMAQLTNVQKEYVNWKQYAQDKKNGVIVALHPQNAGGNDGQKFYEVIGAAGEELLKNQADFTAFNNNTKRVVKVSIWRQKTRLRVYVNEEKIWDIPKAFDATAKYNFVGFRVDGYHKEQDSYFLSNFRLAVGAPDTRNKLINEGKYSTNGILFDVNSDKIKPESFGALKDIANVLTENPDVKVKIVGHTDSDGEDAKNLELSKKRSEAVKNFLIKEFAISGDRLTTDGRGESQPISENTTIEGKANNRRVEFIKL